MARADLLCLRVTSLGHYCCSTLLYSSYHVPTCSHHATASRSACICVQVVMYELLDAWGHNGLISHVKKMQTDYKNRAAIVQEAAGASDNSIQVLAQPPFIAPSTLLNNYHDKCTGEWMYTQVAFRLCNMHSCCLYGNHTVDGVVSTHLF